MNDVFYIYIYALPQGFHTVAKTSQCWMGFQLSSGNTFEMSRQVLQASFIFYKCCGVRHQSARKTIDA